MIIVQLICCYVSGAIVEEYKTCVKGIVDLYRRMLESNFSGIICFMESFAEFRLIPL